MSRGLDASFEKRFTGGPVIRLAGCAISAESGVTVLFGASGSGKTTILRCISGQERPDAGHIRFGGEVWSDASGMVFLPSRKRRIGLVPQDYALFPHLTVAGNVGYGLSGASAAERRHRVGETLEWLGLGGLEKRLPSELSGGQQQRVALARALAPGPRLLLLDEPLSALDHPTRLRLRRELRGLLQAARVPTILVTHDRQEAAALGDDMIVMHQGNMVQHGPVTEVFSKPASLDAADILAVESILSGEFVSMSNRLATVTVNQVPLHALSGDFSQDMKDVFVCLRAEDVNLFATDEHSGSPRNRLPAVVKDCHPEGPLVRVELDCGFPLSAVLTSQGFEELALTKGCCVTASIKASKIHLIGR